MQVTRIDGISNAGNYNLRYAGAGAGVLEEPNDEEGFDRAASSTSAAETPFPPRGILFATYCMHGAVIYS